MDAQLTEIAILIGIFLGVCFRTAIPALRKIVEAIDNGEPFYWDHKYTWSAVLAVLVAVVTTFMGFLQFVPPTEVSPLALMLSCIVYGIGLDAIVIELRKWV